MQVDGLNEINKMLDLVKEDTIIKVNKMNRLRANAFKKQTIDNTRSGNLRLRANTEATVKIQGREHEPIYFTGSLLKNMEVEETVDQIVEAGYFADSYKKTNKSKGLTDFQIASLQTTGYKIPLTGDKGKRVRRWLARKGIFPSDDREFLKVVPRPFMFRAYENAQNDNVDENIVNDYMDKLWAKL